MNMNEEKTLITDADQPASATLTLLVNQTEALPEAQQREVIARQIGGCSAKGAVLQAAGSLLNRGAQLNPVLIAQAVVEVETAWGFMLTAAERMRLIVFHTHLHQPGNMVAALMVLNRVVPTEDQPYDVKFAQAAALLEDAMQRAWSTITRPGMFGDGDAAPNYIKILNDYVAGGGTPFGAATQAYMKPGDQLAPGLTVVSVVPFFHAPPGANNNQQ